MKFNNQAKDRFISSHPPIVLFGEECNISLRCKFNFSYLDITQDGTEKISDWPQEKTLDLFEKLREYSKNSLSFWREQRTGGGGRSVLELYKQFPAKSAFKHPKHVPKDVSWARFRIDSTTRLAGFVIPPELIESCKTIATKSIDSNTFYVVFLDSKHQFYLIDKK